jgi:dUTP pyrophosphatase
MSDIRFHGVIPTRATKDSAGYDLRSQLDIIIPAGATVGIDTGTLAIFPPHLCAMVCSRSGLALRGLAVANAPGIIDADYADTIKVLLHNRTQGDWVIEKGERIAQLVFVEYKTGFDAPQDERVGGLGSTGIA